MATRLQPWIERAKQFADISDKVATFIEEYRTYILNKKPELKNNKIFDMLGFDLMDADTQLSIFELYRTGMQAPWNECGSLEELTMRAGNARDMGMVLVKPGSAVTLGHKGPAHG